MITGTQMISEVRGLGITVEFIDDVENVVSVRLAGRDGAVNRNNAVAEARGLLERLVSTGALPGHLDTPQNQDGEAANPASSGPQTGDSGDADSTAEDDVAHGRRPGTERGAPTKEGDRPLNNERTETDPRRNNADSTPGTGMLPELGSDDDNVSPSG
ncbi:hypothetical protein ACLE20_14210 [Rhizobium sp. YIM 134829]|uniref:hypothetical protein n=1 Tax=Rhizobium sp. YIM 134829 TaxID=3390453 RepID=UPI00397DEE1B